MMITVNGVRRETPAGTTVAALIQDMGLGKLAVAAEVNKAVVPKRSHAAAVLKEGDVVELVTLVGGG